MDHFILVLDNNRDSLYMPTAHLIFQQKGRKVGALYNIRIYCKISGIPYEAKYPRTQAFYLIGRVTECYR